MVQKYLDGLKEEIKEVEDYSVDKVVKKEEK